MTVLSGKKIRNKMTSIYLVASEQTNEPPFYWEQVIGKEAAAPAWICLPERLLIVKSHKKVLIAWLGRVKSGVFFF